MDAFVYKSMYEYEKDDWWYKSLRKITKSFLTRYTKSKGKLLDIGFGTGYVMKDLSKSWDVYGIDVSSYAVKMAKERDLSQVKKADAQHIPYTDNFFDAVLILDVIEHIKDDSRVISEIKRVLKPNGIVIINTPAFPFLWSSHDVSAQHERRYWKKDLLKKLNKNAFTIKKATYINTLLFPLALMHRVYMNNFSKNEHATDIGSVPKRLNGLFFIIFSFEEFLLRFVSFPFGLSIFVVASKK